MPLYEYKCGSCGKTFEVIQKFADEPLRIHAECGGELVKLFSAPAFHLKGTGWYATDYAKKSNGGGSEAKDAKAEAESKKDDAKSESKKDDAKPAAVETKPAAPAETKPSTAA